MSSEKLKDPTWKDLKDIYLALKQGEALERITRPKSHYEGLGLGKYGPETVVALGALDALEDAINEIVIMGMETKEEKDAYLRSSQANLLHTFTETIGVASGSIGATRMEKGYETIGQLGQYLPFGKHEIPQPTHLGAPKDEKRSRFRRD